MTEDIKKLLFEELPKTEFARGLKIYFSEEMDKLNDVSTVISWDDTLGRKKAVEILRKTMKFLELEKIDSSKRVDYR